MEKAGPSVVTNMAPKGPGIIDVFERTWEPGDSR